MHRASRRTASVIAVVVASLSLCGEAHAQADTEVVALDRDLVRLNTSNPPGNEVQVANYMRDRLAPLGFEVDVIQTPTPGKAHLIARLRSANPTGKPVVLSRARRHGRRRSRPLERRPVRRRDPGRLPLRPRLLRRQGRHRGVRDGGDAARPRAGAAHARHRARLRSRRGRRRLRDRMARRESLGQARRRLLHQRGRHHQHRRAGRPQLAAVTVRDKISVSVVLQTRGVSSHSARPQPPSAIDRLARALTRISRHRSAPKLTPLVRRYFRALARDEPAAGRPRISAASPARTAPAGSSGSAGASRGAARSAR